MRRKCISPVFCVSEKIVICEQVGEAAHGKGLTERKVVEIITPGTAVEAEYLDGSVDNYAASLSVSHGKAGFAFIDVTTSSFSATSWPASQMAEHFPKELSLVPARTAFARIVEIVFRRQGSSFRISFPRTFVLSRLAFQREHGV